MMEVVDAVGKDGIGVYKNIWLSPEGHQVLAATKRKFLSNLINNIEERFPEQDMDILQAFRIFDPTKVPPREANGNGDYGEEEINILADYFTAKGK